MHRVTSLRPSSRAALHPGEPAGIGLGRKADMRNVLRVSLSDDVQMVFGPRISGLVP